LSKPAEIVVGVFLKLFDSCDVTVGTCQIVWPWTFLPLIN